MSQKSHGTEGMGTKRQRWFAVGERKAKRGVVDGEIPYKRLLQFFRH